MAGLPYKQIELLLRQICGGSAHNLPEPALHVRPDSLLAVVVAGVGRLKDQDESVAGFSFVLIDEILDRLGLVRRVIVQYNMCLRGLQQLQIRYLAAYLL